MKHIKLYTLISVLLIVKYSLAQNADSTKHKIILLEEVVVSANKVEECKNTIAQQIQVIPAKEIENSQSLSTADLIANTGNVFVQKSQLGGGSPTIRGFEASRILLVVDGIRMNNIIYRAGHLQNIITFDNAILDKTEILFGPSSTVYGSDALGGVIHLFTKNPLFAQENKRFHININAFSRYSSAANEVKGHFDINVGSKKLASLTSFTYSSFGDLEGGKNQNPFYTSSYGERPFYVEHINGKDSLVANSDSYRQKQSAYSQYDVLEKIAYKQNNYVTHGLNFQYSNSTNIPRYDRLTDPKGTGLSYAEWYYGPQERLLTAYDLSIKNPEATFQNVHFDVNYQGIEESRHSRKFGKNDLTHRIENVTVLGLNLDFQRIIKSHNIRFGLDGQYNSLKSTANSENIITGISSQLDTRYPDGENTMADAALYITHSWQINEQLVLNDGLRIGYSALHSTFVDTSFYHFPYTSADQKTPVYSGSAGIVNNPTDDWKLSALISTGFRVPNVDDLSKVFESAAGSVIVPNPNLKPERTINTEIGITKVFNNNAIWENSFYYTTLTDAIIADKFTFNGEDSIMYDGTLSEVIANQNKKKAYIYGFSSNFKSQCSDHFSFSCVMNYTYGRLKTDSSDAPLDHIPPFMAHLMLTYVNHNFSSDFFVNYNGWKKLKDYYINGEDNEQYATPDGMPAWVTINLHTSFKIQNNITIQAGVDNILDTQYRYFASGINAPGRNVYTALRFNFINKTNRK